MKKTLLTLLTVTALTLSMGATALNAAQGNKPKPFLIQGKLPHLTMMVKILWDDEDLALTKEQQSKLLLVRKETMSGAKALGKQILPLEEEIVKASQDRATPASLKAKVEKLAALRAEATMIHLNCIYKTREILTDEQIYVIE